MSNMPFIPRGAAAAIDDMLDHCAKIKPGQEVLLLAQVDGLYGGHNLVDELAFSWIQNAVQHRRANPHILWFDNPNKPHHWRIPPVVKAAIKKCDVLINHSFDLVTEEIMELRALEPDIIILRNFATTANLLCTAWAQTPHELVSEIRYQAATPFKENLPFQLIDDNGTHLEGTIGPSKQPNFPTYANRRPEKNGYRPWPEWCISPIHIRDTSGIFVFDRMLSWWSRYIGISPFLKEPIRLTIDRGRITKIEGGEESDALNSFLASMKERLGEGVYNFSEIHTGVHPQAMVGMHQCPSLNYRRLIEHGHSSNIHLHIGTPPATESYPYWMHCTGDVRTATWRVGDTLIHDRGHLTALDHPEVIAVAQKYPDRPGLKPVPWNY